MVARTDSLTEAARQLGLSVPALSRRIQLLEGDLGTPLLRRLPRGVALTENGSAFFEAVGQAVDDLHDATKAFRDRSDRRAVRVSLIAAFANYWLMPRLAAYRRQNPAIDIQLETSSGFVDMDADRCDLAIRLGEGGWPGVRAETLLPIEVFPVCSPTLASVIARPTDLLRQVLIGPDHRPEFWPEWIGAAGLDPGLAASVRPVDSLLLYETAANGMGVAIGLDPLVRPFLASGRLVRPLDVRVRSSRSFYIVRPPGTPRRAVRSFQRWLMAQARADAAMISRLAES